MTIATGQPMLASDINDLTFFPKGTILMFSSEAWNATTAEFKTIWKICDGQNGTPNLVNKFLRGGTASGATGDGKKILSVSELPSHNHIMGTAGSHTHTVKEGSMYGGNGTLASGDDYTADAAYYQTTSEAGNHTHTIGNTGSGASFDIVPAFYTVIYII
jgi:hypothetical protein